MGGRHCSRSQSQSLSHLSWPPLIEQGCGSAALCAVDVAPHLGTSMAPAVPSCCPKKGRRARGCEELAAGGGHTHRGRVLFLFSIPYAGLGERRAIQRPPDSGAGLGLEYVWDGACAPAPAPIRRSRRRRRRRKWTSVEDRSCFEQRAPRHPTSIRTLILRTPRTPCHCQPWRVVPCLMLRGVPAMSGG